ncbi:MAG: TRAP transporter fused permease subunit [bacterium]
MAEKAQPEERYRKLEHPAMRLLQRALLWGLTVIAIFYNFDVPSRAGLMMLPEQYLGIILVLVLSSIFLSAPAHRGAPRTRASWYDLALSLLSVVVGGYLAIYYPRIVNEVGELTPDKVWMGLLALFLVMEAARRITGWVLVVISGVFIFYALFADFFPGILYMRAIPWPRVAVHLFIDPNALLGIPLNIVSTIVIAFIFFGQVLFASGGGAFFTDLAMAVMGRFRGGAAKISLVASALFGTISGSPVANVVVVGFVSIPMMIRSGYRPHVAGAVESVASNGGQLMPPVMGAAAFVMAEFLGLPYGQVAIAALIPALLYYVALFVQVDLEAGKMGILRLPEEEIPPLAGSLRRGWIFILPLVLIIYILFVLNLHAAKAGFFSAAFALALTYLMPKKRIGWRKFLEILEKTGLAMLEVAVVCAVAGVVIGVLTLTGLGFVFTLVIENYGKDNLLLILVLTGFVALILGMGMPTTAVYVIVALALAPALMKLGIPAMSAHLFVFYYAMLSMITPPICIAAFAGAAIAGSNPMRTGFACMRLGIIAYLVPFIFVLDPLLLMDGPGHLVILAAITAIAGTVVIGTVMVGYFLRPVPWVLRILLGLGGLSLLIPPGGEIPYSWALNGAGAVVCGTILFREWRLRAKGAPSGQAEGFPYPATGRNGV